MKELKRKLRLLYIMNIQVSNESGYFYTEYPFLKKNDRLASRLYRSAILSGQRYIEIDDIQYTMI